LHIQFHKFSTELTTGDSAPDPTWKRWKRMEMETEMGWEVEMGRTGLDIPRYATVKKS